LSAFFAWKARQNGKIEEWKYGSKNVIVETRKNGNLYKGALKAQLHIAQGTTLGKGTHPTISAP
jgi:hypothetical protein